MVPNFPDGDTQSIPPASNSREIARQDLQRLNEAVARPEHIGPYKILETLGEGGMGVVYLAEQTKPIHRKVALKLIKLGMDTKQVMARFEAEREALALMNHPNVARVFDAGATEQGRPYFVMEYVEGEALTKYCDGNRLSTKERLKLFMQVCHAVQHAHQKGIIHRDLKPSNVLVTKVDDAPAVKVIDFGIAKATQQRLTDATLFTEQGQLVGTPAYMSPEQADATVQDIDTRTDIYSLGVILYQLLVGALPFEPQTFRQAALMEILRIIREVDPPKPSTRLIALRSGPRAPSTDSSDPGGQVMESAQSIAALRQTDPASLVKQLRGDLDWIVMKCLEKDRARRYDSANGIALELERYLHHEPVLAGPPSATYRVGKFIRRNRLAVTAAVVVIFALTAGLVISDLQRRRAVRAEELAAIRLTDAETARDEAIQARDESDQVTQFLADTLAAVDPGQQGKDVTVREVLDKSAETIGEKFSGKPLVEAKIRMAMGVAYSGLGLYESAKAHYVDAGAKYRRLLGKRHPRTLLAMDNLSIANRLLGHYSESEALARSTLEILRRDLGDEHPDTVRSLANLAASLFEKGRYAEAEELFRKLLEIQSRLLGEEHPNTLQSMQNLAVSLFGNGRDAEREELFRRVLEIQRRVQGDEHPQTLHTMQDLASDLDDEGRCAEAEELLRKTLEIRRRILGNQHPETLRSMATLARSLKRQGRYVEAEEICRNTLEITRRVLGEEHQITLLSMNVLAECLYRQGLYTEAEDLLRRTLEINRRVRGEENANTLVPMYLLADSLDKQGRYVEAEELFRRILEISRRVWGEEHLQTLRSMNNLANSLNKQGRYVEAEEFYRKTLEIRRRVLGEEHPDFAQTLLGLADLREKTEQLTEAEQLSRQAGSILALQLPPEHSLRKYNVKLLGRILCGLERFSEAEPLLIESFDRLKDDPTVLPHDKKEMVECLVRLYESWDAAEPGKGYAEKANEYRRLSTSESEDNKEE